MALEVSKALYKLQPRCYCCWSAASPRATCKKRFSLTTEEFSVKKLILPITILTLLLTACGGGLSDDDVQNNPGAATPSSSCPTPLLQTPVDLSIVTSILYPGQERGGNYKAHGGFGFDNATDNSVTVKIPLSGKITRVVRYKEMGELQYLFEFEGDCGVSFRFDHLRKLTAKFEAVVNAFPIKEDTRTDPVSPPVPVMVGEVIATEVGFLNNVSVDFGVYDMRQKNEASKDPAWASAHSQYPADSYGICWFDSLPQADSLVVKSLPSRDGTNQGKTSDYCK